MHPVLATLSTLAIFFVPGLVWVSRLGGGRKPVRLTLGEQAYLVLAGSLVVSGWVGLVLAELGQFAPGRVAVLVSVGTLAVAVLARRRLSARLGSMGGAEAAGLVFLLGFAWAVYFPPFEYVLGGRDPGIYVNTGFHLAREGNLVYFDTLIDSIPEEAHALFFRVDREVAPWRHARFLGYHLESPDTPWVVSQGLHLYPVWIGLAASLFEMKAGLYATPFFALLGVLGLFFATRRLFDVTVAILAASLLAVFQIQIWFARFPNSEILVLFLYVTGLLAFSIMDRERSAVAGLLAGAAFGSTLLVRVESILFFVPLGLYLGWKRMRRELGKPEAAFLLALGVLTAHAVIHDRLISWPYVANVLNRHYWRWVGQNLLWLALGGMVAFVVADRWVTRFGSQIVSRLTAPRLRGLAALGVFLVAAYAYFIRPVWHGARTAPHDAEAFLRMGWYLYPVGLALAVAGAMLLIARSDRRSALFVLVGLTFSFFFFYKVRVWHDHYFAMRRFVPVILPSLFVAIAVFLVSLREMGGRFARWGPYVIGGSLFVAYLSAGVPLWRHEEFRGSLRFVQELARHVGDRDVVLFPRQEGLHLLELPLAELEGKNVLEFYTLKPDRALLEKLIRKWRQRYGDVFFVTNYKISLSGFFTRHVKDFWFATEKYEYAYAQPPRRPEPFHLRFTLSKAVDMHELAGRVPTLPLLDVGGSDDLQVAWFHEKELDEDGASYRWTERMSSVFLPALGPQSREIVMRLAGPEERPAPLHPVRLGLNGEPLATVSPTRQFEVYSFGLPPGLRSRLTGTFPILTVETTTWRPANVVPEASDIRDLGVRVDWIEVR